MSSGKIKKREEIDQSHKWDLSHLFESDDLWEKLYKNIESKIEKYNKFKNRMGESLEIFRETIEFDLEISRNIEKIYTYAHLKSDENKSDQFYLAMYQKSVNLYTRLSEAASFITPEIQSIDNNIIENFMKDNSMKKYLFYLEQILRFKPHTRTHEIEQILAMSGDIGRAPSQIFSQLDNADMKFGTLTDNQGNEIELSHGNFSTFLINPDRELRKKAFNQYYKSYEDMKNTIAETLAHSNQKDFFYAKVRNFNTSREASLFSDNMPIEVYDNLVNTVRDNTAPLFKYFNFRKEALNLEELHIYDTYVPIVKNIDFRMTYEEAVEISTKALSPLGENYCKTLKEGLLGGWVDRYENKGKRSGAYSSGCYDSPPYILMNYEDVNINSLYTLIHEAGHSMHTLYSQENQPYFSSDYTIFVAEVASTFNETLLSKYLLELYKDDKKMKAYILNREIDNIRATLYRQTMFAEFEKRSHEIVERNEPLTLDVIRLEYYKLLNAYFDDTLVIDEALTLECLRIPHFYSPFYVYKYATGISAAIALTDRVLSLGENAKNEYLNFLKLGGSMYPLDELKIAGVDMTSPEPIKKAIAHFTELVDRFIDMYNTL